MRRLNVRAVTAICTLALSAAGASGCDSTTSATATIQTAPSVLVTETFTGTITVGGATTFSFAVAGSGAVTGTIVSIAPDANIALGIALGTWNGTQCQAVISNDSATSTITVTGASSAAGNLCVRAYDVGRLTQTQTVQLSVTHF